MEIDLGHIRDVPYEGNVTACHSLAMLSAYFPDAQAPDLSLFEALTTVPFGLVSVLGDPNRILNTWCDPDIGLDRACAVLGLAYEVHWWHQDVHAEEALTRLHQWVHEGPVVIGPLNMDGLTYLFDRQLFKACDHFLVVWGVDHNGWWISDNERSVAEVLGNTELIDAWRADRIPEGRGAFVMRRLKKDSVPKMTSYNLANVLVWTQNNIRESEITDRGGASAYEALSRDMKSSWSPSFRRALSYALPTRIQRIRHQHRLLHELLEQEAVPSNMKENIVPLLYEEINLLALAANSIQNDSFPSLDKLPEVYREISVKWCSMEVKNAFRL